MNCPAVIRLGVSSDIDALVKLLELLFQIEADFAFDRVKQRRGLEMLLSKGNDSCLMVAELNKEIIGMCSAQLLVSTAEGGLKAIIEDMVVAEHYRGQNIGGRLLTEIETWAGKQGAKRLDLLADCHNTPALQFYEHMRWSRTELIGLQKKISS